MIEGRRGVGIVESLATKPGFVNPIPGLPTRVHPALAQQQFRQPVPCGHQVTAAILTRTHQVAGGFLLHGRNRHRGGQAWNLRFVAVILANPRYTGRQVWNVYSRECKAGEKFTYRNEQFLAPILLVK